MKRYMRQLAFLLVCACLLCGCTESRIFAPSPEDLPPISSEGLVWSQLWDDWGEEYENTDTYPFIDSINAYFSDEEGSVQFFLLTNTVITEEEAKAYAMEAVKGLAKLISWQNPDYAEPSDSSFGGYLSNYNIYVIVAPDGTKSDKSTWILEDTVPAGEYREFQNSAAAE